MISVKDFKESPVIKLMEEHDQALEAIRLIKPFLEDDLNSYITDSYRTAIDAILAIDTTTTTQETL